MDKEIKLYMKVEGEMSKCASETAEQKTHIKSQERSIAEIAR